MKVPEYASIFGFLVVETETGRIVKKKEVLSLIDSKKLIITLDDDKRVMVITSQEFENKYTIQEYKGE